MNKHGLLDYRADELVGAVGFEIVEDQIPGVSVTVYELPRPGRIYSLGCDFALGQQGRDLDTGCVMDATDEPAVQVAEYAGTLGEYADKLAYATACFYNGAFITGERQFGLPSLRRLLREFGYGWLYYERDEKKKNRPLSDKLGYFKAGNWTTDPLLRNFRMAVRSGAVQLRSPDLFDEMRRLQYKPKTSIKDPEDALDVDLTVKLSGGGSPDRVMAAAYSYLGCKELVNFPRVIPKYAPGTFGDILGLDIVLSDAAPRYKEGTPARLRARQVATVNTTKRKR